jgi:hypothetical protein
MTKKELIEMLSEVPDNAQILLTYTTYNLIDTSVHTQNIQGYYEYKGSYILCGLNVRPNSIERHD